MAGFNLEKAKKVKTFNGKGETNGYLIELNKSGDLTTCYLSCTAPGAFKGYHLHLVREANYVCIRGKIKVIMYYPNARKEVILDANDPEHLHIPALVPTALVNEWEEEAWIVNNPMPYYDPNFKDEQVELTEEECEKLLSLGQGYLKIL